MAWVAPAVIHGENAVAPLKAATGVRRWQSSCGHPRRKRRGPIEGIHSEDGTSLLLLVIHGENAVAPLKPCGGALVRAAGGRHPRRKRRGPIEALQPWADTDATTESSTAKTPWPH